jgi:hypothetical protein
MEVKLTIDDQHAATFLHFLQTLTYVTIQPIQPKKTGKKKEMIAVISQKEELRAAFAKMEGLNMFSKIEDPKKWQKQQRDEWE